MIEQLGELICSQENQPGTSKSIRKIAEQLKFIDHPFSEL